MSERLFKTFHIGRGRGVWSRLTGVATNRVRNAVGKAVSFSSVTLTQFFPKRFSEWLFLKFVVFLLSCGRIRTETFKNDACVSRSRSWREVLKKKCLTSLRIERFAYLLKKAIPLSGQLLKAACENRRPFGSYALLVPAPRKERLLFWNSKIARS